MEKKNERFSRRSFARRIAELAAATGIAGLLLDRFRSKPLLPPVQADTASYLHTVPNAWVLSAENTSGTGTAPLFPALGVGGYASSATGFTSGVLGFSKSNSGVGVTGRTDNSSGSGRGVDGQSYGDLGVGVYGTAFSATGGTKGVVGETNSPDGTGVRGYANVAGGVCVAGSAQDPNVIPIAAYGNPFGGAQVADLQQWVTRSLLQSTVVARVDKNGSFRTRNFLGFDAVSSLPPPVGVCISAPASQSMGLFTSSVERVRIDPSGQVGIGITAPTAALHIKAAIPIFRFTGTSLPNNQWHFGRFDQSNRFTIAETGVGDYLTILGGSGNVGLSNINPAQKLDVNGNVRCVQLIQTSDVRFKEDVAPIPDALERLDHVRGVTFEWKKHYESLREAAPGRQVGLIAQEVEEAFPELVTRANLEDVKDARGVDYGRFTAILVEAVKELRRQKDKEINELHRQNKEKTREVDELRARLEKLEQAMQLPYN